MARASLLMDGSDLGRRLSEGGEDAVRNLIPYLFHRALGLRFAGRFGLDGSEIDDLVAVAAFKVWTNRASYQPNRESFGPWCDVILRHTAIDLVRDRSRQLPGRTTLPPESIASPVEAGGPDHPSRVALRAVLDALSPTDRRILEAAANEPDGHWAAAMAAELGLTSGAIRVRRLRVVQRIRAELVGLGFPFTSLTEIHHDLPCRSDG